MLFTSVLFHRLFGPDLPANSTKHRVEELQPRIWDLEKFLEFKSYKWGLGRRHPRTRQWANVGIKTGPPSEHHDGGRRAAVLISLLLATGF